MRVSPVPAKNIAAPLQQRVVRRYLPLVVTLLLSVWITGGWSPTTWGYLFEVITHWHAIAARQGTALLPAFLVLLAQSILLISAWILLIILIYREVRSALPAHVQSQTDESGGIARPGLQATFQRFIATMSAQTQETRALKLKTASASATMLTEPEAIVENVPIIPAMPAATVITSASSSPAADTEDKQLEPEQVNDQQSAAVHQDEEALYVLDYPFESADTTNTEPDASISGNNPFNTSADILTLFEAEPSAADNTAEDEQTVNNTEPAYVFGNPFDGPLPDVFTSDDDLKRVVREQQEEQRHSLEKAAEKAALHNARKEVKLAKTTPHQSSKSREEPHD
ncbi:hypothetical protein ccbrp13_30980 [Ktedonobacteria bacterium brp13]|nr:hypothetical protein ccbrp13_30980 [Ktedonobacteria bacterium brp13]